MNERLRELVRLRARRTCEYCRVPESASGFPFECDHIVARQHRGPTSPGNLAYACYVCNATEGPNIAGLDGRTHLVRLYNPRRHKWSHHFRWDGAVLTARTAIGRVTLYVLDINRRDQTLIRESLLLEGFVLATD